jgi:uncharacterized membrane protein
MSRGRTVVLRNNCNTQRNTTRLEIYQRQYGRRAGAVVGRRR